LSRRISSLSAAALGRVQWHRARKGTVMPVNAAGDEGAFLPIAKMRIITVIRKAIKVAPCAPPDPLGHLL
jgi:hypothetical protein